MLLEMQRQRPVLIREGFNSCSLNEDAYVCVCERETDRQSERQKGEEGVCMVLCLSEDPRV